ncbi:GtrA family protein [Streptomyces sp. NPDC002758]
MSGRHALPSRWGKLYQEIAKFGIVGASGFVVNLAVFNVIRTLTQWQTVRASVLATAVAILTNYLGLRYFAYRDQGGEDRNSRRKEMGLFLFFSGIGLVIENGVLYATTYGLGWDSPLANNVSKFLGIGLATVFRFWSYRMWVFRAADRSPEPATPFPPHPEPLLNATWERV